MTTAIGQRPASVVQAQSAAQEGASGGKLQKSAREFEAILLQSWLEKMNHSFLGSEDSQDPAHETVSSLGTQAIATALAARGGIGIAAMILRQLGASSQGVPQGGPKAVSSGS